MDVTPEYTLVKKKCLLCVRWALKADHSSPMCLHCGEVAGLAAYASWAATLQLLLVPGGPPCYFTDYCEEAAVRGAQVLATFLGVESGATLILGVEQGLKQMSDPYR